VTAPALAEAIDWETADTESHEGQCMKRWVRSPHDDSRWMLKVPECYEGNGCWREIEVAVALRELGYLSYHVAEGEWEGYGAVLIQHVEDANPEWRLVGDFDSLRHSDGVPLDMWLPYAAVAIALGINDRHSGNGLVMEHRTTGERTFVSIDHECECDDGDSYPWWMASTSTDFERITWSQLERAVNEVVSTAQARGLGHLVRQGSIDYVFDPVNREYFVGVLEDA
jgi:hypothetical protein